MGEKGSPDAGGEVSKAYYSARKLCTRKHLNLCSVNGGRSAGSGSNTAGVGSGLGLVTKG